MGAPDQLPHEDLPEETFDLDLFLTTNLPSVRAGAMKAARIYGGDEDEILSLTLTTLWDKKRELGSRPSDEGRQAFVASTLRNHARNSARGERRARGRVVLGLDEWTRNRAAPEDQQPHQQMETKQQAEAIMGAIADLPDGLMKDTMFYMATLKMNRAAACEAMGTTRNHLRQLLAAAGPSVRAALERRGIRPGAAQPPLDAAGGDHDD